MGGAPSHVEIYHHDGGGESFDSMAGMCTAMAIGATLCSVDQICPDGDAGTLPVGGEQNFDDMWLPVVDASQPDSKQWVQVGRRAGGTCNRLTAYHAANIAGSWMETATSVPYKQVYACCTEVAMPHGARIRLKSWSGEYLHRPDSAQGVTTWNTGIGNEWAVEELQCGKIRLKSWKGDYLERRTSRTYEHRPKGCVVGNDISPGYTGQTVAECAARCDANPSCLAFEYGVNYGGSGGMEWRHGVTHGVGGGGYKPQDCLLKSSTNDGGCDEFTTVYMKGSYGALDDAAKFNLDFRSSSHGIIRRECKSCASAYQDVYIRRFTSHQTWDAYSYLMVTWRDDNNRMNTDFAIYSSLQDALDDTNRWKFCNYNDPGIGFPRDCGATGYVGWQWNSLTRGGQAHIKYSVHNWDTDLYILNGAKGGTVTTGGTGVGIEWTLEKLPNGRVSLKSSNGDYLSQSQDVTTTGTAWPRGIEWAVEVLDNNYDDDHTDDDDGDDHAPHPPQAGILTAILKDQCHMRPTQPSSACTAGSIKLIGWKDNWEDSESPVCMGHYVSVDATCEEYTHGPRSKAIKAYEGYCAPSVVEYARLSDELSDKGIFFNYGYSEVAYTSRFGLGGHYLKDAESGLWVRQPDYAQISNPVRGAGSNACVDGSWSRKKHNKPARKCDWVGRKPLKRCGKKDAGGTRAYLVCRVACNTCD
jgi:hypothetical protein